jgi:7-carboxy-7-deazaguanine synthase
MAIKVSEMFRSIQGEGDMTGRLSIWIRFFGCNLKCRGFYQVDPTNEKTYQKTVVDWTKVQKMADLPVFEFGCDSEYSWHPEYKKLVTNYKDAAALVDDLKPFLYNNGKDWQHPITENMIDLCFTGGEPMLQQKAIVDIMKEVRCNDRDITVQIETNGTKKLDQVLIDYYKQGIEHDIHFNISPKLFPVSGEKGAVKHENIFAYQELTTSGILKFVMNNDDAAWQDLNLHVKVLRDMGVWLPVYIMPVGATKEQQEDRSVIASIANRAIDNGYHVSGRVHAIMFGNGMGT